MRTAKKGAEGIRDVDSGLGASGESMCCCLYICSCLTLSKGGSLVVCFRSRTERDGRVKFAGSVGNDGSDPVSSMDVETWR